MRPVLGRVGVSAAADSDLARVALAGLGRTWRRKLGMKKYAKPRRSAKITKRTSAPQRPGSCRSVVLDARSELCAAGGVVGGGAAEAPTWRLARLAVLRGRASARRLREARQEIMKSRRMHGKGILRMDFVVDDEE